MREPQQYVVGRNRKAPLTESTHVVFIGEEQGGSPYREHPFSLYLGGTGRLPLQRAPLQSVLGRIREAPLT